MILSDSSLFGWLFWAIFGGGGDFSVPSLIFSFFLSFFSPRITGGRERDWLRGKGTESPESRQIQQYSAGLPTLVLWDRYQRPKMRVGHGSVSTGRYMHCFCTGFLGSASRTSAGHGSDRGVWRLGLTVLIDIMSVRTPGCNYGGPPRRRVFPGARVASQTDYQNPQFGAPNQM